MQRPILYILLFDLSQHRLQFMFSTSDYDILVLSPIITLDYISLSELFFQLNCCPASCDFTLCHDKDTV